MKHKTLAASLLTLMAASVWADAPTIIQSSDKAALTAAVGTEVTVEGKVESAKWSASGKVCNIKFEGEPTFVVAVFEKSRGKLDEAFGGDFAKQFSGATLRITGKLAEYGGRDPKYKDAGALQIILSQTGQVTVMSSATSQPATQPATAPAS
ncbi:MAG: hypothetical protein JWM57_541 [Phycisphaerales bacterium]|nr:hypothetical protein [Phycisphaerales bacterium]